MKTPIETNQKFVFRLEDFIYLLLIAYILPFGTFIYQTVKHNSQKDSTIPQIILICLIGMCITAPISLILLSYRKRIQDRYFIEDESIIRIRNGKKLFQIPFKEIISVRVYNRKGKQGSIVFFTNLSSRNYSSIYFPLNSMIPVSIYGLTKKKINLVKDRKKLLTAIYLANPNLHFID